MKRMRRLKRGPGRRTEVAGLAMHSAASADWGTPMLLRRFAASVLRAAARTTSPIDLDYATSSYWQEWWPAGDRPHAYLDGSPGRDVLVAMDRAAVAQPRGTGFFNPPGLDGGGMVQQCWSIFEQDHREEKLGSGVWVGFSLEQFASFQGLSERHPLMVGEDDLITTIVPSRRCRYLLHPEQFIAITRKKQSRRDKQSKQWKAEQRKISQLRGRSDDAPVPGNAPSHASYITILWSHVRSVRRRQMAAAWQFLSDQSRDEKSLLYRFAVIGSLDMRRGS